eukprot:jgi/Botrbrau1/11530/Bobra.0393s0009.1
MPVSNDKAKGKKKSPFVGKSERNPSSTAPILYERYSSIADIILDTTKQAELPDPNQQGPLDHKPRQATTTSLNSAARVTLEASERVQKRRKAGQDPDSNKDIQLPDIVTTAAVQGTDQEEPSAKKRKKSKSKHGAEAQAHAASIVQEEGTNARMDQAGAGHEATLSDGRGATKAKKPPEGVTDVTGYDNLPGKPQKSTKVADAQPRSAAFNPESEEYYTPEGLAERRRAKREKRVLRRTGAQTPAQPEPKPSNDFSAGANGSHATASAAASEGQVGIVVASVRTAAEQKEDPDGSLKEKTKKKRKKSSGGQPEWISGPGNAAEAVAIRAKLGYNGPKQMDPKARTFTFGFKPESVPVAPNQAEPETSEDEDEANPNPDGIASKGYGTGAGNTPRAGHNGEAGAGVGPASEKTTAAVHGDGGGTRDAGILAQMSRRVFIGGMPFRFEEDDVREYWSYCGEIESLSLMRFPDTKRFKGIAFITFVTEEGFQEALKCDGSMLEGVRIKVEACKAPPPSKSKLLSSKPPSSPPRRPSAPALKTPGYLVAYVGNVAFEASAEDVSAVFEGCNVTRVRLHTERDTGRPKGFAHVHFLDEPSLDRAVTFNGAELYGRAIKVGYAQPPRNAGKGADKARD